jgi:hypothetical protein
MLMNIIRTGEYIMIFNELATHCHGRNSYRSSRHSIISTPGKRRPDS